MKMAEKCKFLKLILVEEELIFAYLWGEGANKSPLIFTIQIH